ncbi:MAG: hypothetical protein KDB53_21145 [Planctomycetes bacterium]|nr:hypothetical protein [Planctomycetota bacterium]
MNSTDKYLDQWSETRKRGKLRYVLAYGVVGWGVLTAVLFSFIMSLMGDGGTFLSYLAVSIIVFPIGGILFGSTMWTWSERKHRRRLESSGPKSP